MMELISFEAYAKNSQFFEGTHPLSRRYESARFDARAPEQALRAVRSVAAVVNEIYGSRFSNDISQDLSYLAARFSLFEPYMDTHASRCKAFLSFLLEMATAQQSAGPSPCRNCKSQNPVAKLEAADCELCGGTGTSKTRGPAALEWNGCATRLVDELVVAVLSYHASCISGD